MPAYDDEKVIEDFWRKHEIRSMGASVKRQMQHPDATTDPGATTDPDATTEEPATTEESGKHTNIRWIFFSVLITVKSLPRTGAFPQNDWTLASVLREGIFFPPLGDFFHCRI